MQAQGQCCSACGKAECDADDDCGELAQTCDLKLFLHQLHNSPFKFSGVEDSDGVRASGAGTCDEQRGQTQERAGIFSAAAEIGSHLIAEDFAALSDVLAREPREWVVADGQG